MAYEASLGTFQGPLDVLFGLAERGELDVEMACLAVLVRQYVDYLTEVEQEPPDRLAEALLYLVKLVALKAHRLVAPPEEPCPEPEEEEPDPGLLARRLEEYNLYYQLRLALGERAESGMRSFLRLAPLPASPSEQRLAPGRTG